MRKVILLFVLIFALSVTGCSGPSIKKGQKLIEDEKYDEAIEVFETLIDKDEENYDAWFGILDAQMEDKEYEDAADTLEDLYEVIEDSISPSDEDEDSDSDDEEDEDSKDDEKDSDSDEDVVSTFLEYCEKVNKKLEKDGDSLGSWYYDLMPEYVDLYSADTNYGTYAQGDVITLDLPEGVQVYYNFDEDEVTEEDTLYKDGIVLDQEGEFYITAAAFNQFGKSEESTLWVSVSTPPEAPAFTQGEGTYPSPFILTFENYNTDDFDLYYTTDGSDPVDNGYWYDPDYPDTLSAGEYEVRAVMYDWNSGLYSEEVTTKYVVEAMAGPVIDQAAGTYPAPFNITFSGFNNDTQTVYYTLDGSDPIDNGWYYSPDYSVVLDTPGTYTIKAVIYDYDIYDYSEVTSVDIVIE